MIRAIFWDNDGVLVDTEHLYFQATRQVLASAGLFLTSEEFVELLLVQSRGAWHMLAERGYSESEIAEFRAQRNRVYSDLLQSEKIHKDGVREVLKALHGRYRMGIVTSSLREHFDIIHRSSGLLEFFEFALVSGDYEKYKPAPDPYLKALEKTGLKPEECIVVEDSLRGLTSALGAGIRCYVIPNELTRKSDFSGAAKVLEHVSDLLPELV